MMLAGSGTPFRRAMGVVVALLVSAAGPVLGAPACARQCKERVAACRRVECANVGGGARRKCVERCRGLAGCGAIRTLAYVVAECHEDASGYSARHALRVQQGNCEPVTVAELETPTPMPDPFPPDSYSGLRRCELYGRQRAGYRSVFVGPFTRLGVSPDGAVVVFEVTDDFSDWPAAFPPPLREGIYRVGADGGGLEWLGPPSRAASFRFFRNGSKQVVAMGSFDVLFKFSPDGHLIVFTDRGPDPGGIDATQVVTLDVETGERRQVTHRSPIRNEDLTDDALYIITGPRFADRDTIVYFDRFPDGEFLKAGWFRVHADGSGLEPAVVPIALPDSRINQTFDIADGGTNIVGVELQRSPFITELFLLSNRSVVQLTNFHRDDTGVGGKLLDRRANRGYFTASANPLATQNPSNNCQLFSIDTLGTRLRQLTHFQEVDKSDTGCGYGLSPGCAIGPIFQDEITRDLVFYSSCDPFDTGTFGGQIFTMHPDGTGLRQLSDFRGLSIDTDGAVSVELPGPVAYSAEDGGRAIY